MSKGKRSTGGSESHDLVADTRENTARRIKKDMKHKGWHKGQVASQEESVRA